MQSQVGFYPDIKKFPNRSETGTYFKNAANIANLT